MVPRRRAQGSRPGPPPAVGPSHEAPPGPRWKGELGGGGSQGGAPSNHGGPGMHPGAHTLPAVVARPILDHGASTELTTPRACSPPSPAATCCTTWSGRGAPLCTTGGRPLQSSPTTQALQAAEKPARGAREGAITWAYLGARACQHCVAAAPMALTRSALKRAQREGHGGGDGHHPHKQAAHLAAPAHWREVESPRSGRLRRCRCARAHTRDAGAPKMGQAAAGPRAGPARPGCGPRQVRPSSGDRPGDAQFKLPALRQEVRLW